MPCFSRIGPPNASRSDAQSHANSNAARAIPRACAATIGRVCSNAPSVADPRASDARASSKRRSSLASPPSR